MALDQTVRSKSGKSSINPTIGKLNGIEIERRFTRAGVDPLADVSYELRDSVITNPDGSVVFEMRGAEIPTSWSQLATDIAVSKYFRKAGIHGDSKRGERSVRELVWRVAHSIREAGEKQGGYFASPEAADIFEAELLELTVPIFKRLYPRYESADSKSHQQ